MLATLVVFSFCFLIYTLFVDKKRQVTAESFITANRNNSGWSAALSIAASWIWAPALFVSTQVGYQWGPAGLFWFVVPNMLALLIFAPLTTRIRKRFPHGYSLLNSISKNNKPSYYSFLTIHLAIQILSFAMQITAGAMLLASFTKISFILISCLMIFIPLLYSYKSGLVSSIKTDAMQYWLIIFALIVILIPNTSTLTGGIISPIKFNDFNIFNFQMLTSFGIASTLTLLFGIFSDQQQWQRVFSMPSEKVITTYSRAAFLHALVTLTLGIFGYLIKLQEFTPNNLSIVGAEYISANLPNFALAAFMLLVLSGLCSTIDSCYCAFSSLWAKELSKNQNKIKASRNGMILLSLFGLSITILKIPVISLWMLIGLVRLAITAPTILVILKPNLQRLPILRSLVLSLAISTPIYLLALYLDESWLKTLSLSACFLISCIALVIKTKKLT